jgi:ankyrin repeat protein
MFCFRHYVEVRGAQVNLDVKEINHTALSYAAEHGKNKAIAGLVKKCGAAVDFETSGGRTALVAAASTGQHEAATLLLQLGAAAAFENAGRVVCGFE